MSIANASRERMLNELEVGAVGSGTSTAFASGSLLIRGCDPVMAIRAAPMLQSHLGTGVDIVACTDDDDFISNLSARKWSVVMFAPGACRFSAGKQPIPGGNLETVGWGLEQYKSRVVQTQGEDVSIVETTEEREMIPLLKAAFKIA